MGTTTVYKSSVTNTKLPWESGASTLSPRDRTTLQTSLDAEIQELARHVIFKTHAERHFQEEGKPIAFDADLHIESKSLKIKGVTQPTFEDVSTNNFSEEDINSFHEILEHILRKTGAYRAPAAPVEHSLPAVTPLLSNPPAPSHIEEAIEQGREEIRRLRDEMQTQHTEQMRRQEESHQTQLEVLQQEHKEALTRLSDDAQRQQEFDRAEHKEARQEHREQMQQLRGEQQRQREGIESALEQTKEQHRQAYEQLQAAHQTQLETLHQEHRENLTQLREEARRQREDNRAARNESQRAHQEQMRQLREDHQHATKELKAAHQRERETLTQTLTQANEYYRQEMERLQAAHRETMEATKAYAANQQRTIDNLLQQLEDSRRSYKESLERIQQAHLDQMRLLTEGMKETSEQISRVLDSLLETTQAILNFLRTLPKPDGERIPPEVEAQVKKLKEDRKLLVYALKKEKDLAAQVEKDHEVEMETLESNLREAFKKDDNTQIIIEFLKEENERLRVSSQLFGDEMSSWVETYLDGKLNHPPNQVDDSRLQEALERLERQKKDLAELKEQLQNAEDAKASAEKSLKSEHKNALAALHTEIDALKNELSGLNEKPASQPAKVEPPTKKVPQKKDVKKAPPKAKNQLKPEAQPNVVAENFAALVIAMQKVESMDLTNLKLSPQDRELLRLNRDLLLGVELTMGRNDENYLVVKAARNEKPFDQTCLPREFSIPKRDNISRKIAFSRVPEEEKEQRSAIHTNRVYKQLLDIRGKVKTHTANAPETASRNLLKHDFFKVLRVVETFATKEKTSFNHIQELLAKSELSPNEVEELQRTTTEIVKKFISYCWGTEGNLHAVHYFVRELIGFNLVSNRLPKSWYEGRKLKNEKLQAARETAASLLVSLRTIFSKVTLPGE